jgi:hypothetical protein
MRLPAIASASTDGIAASIVLIVPFSRITEQQECQA